MANLSGSMAVDEYVAGFPPERRKGLEEMRAFIRPLVPGGVEKIAYRMPTFDIAGKHVVHYAAFTNHLGLYPTASPVEAFESELGPYVHSRGSIQFPLGKPIPWDLVRRIVEFKVAELSNQPNKAKKSKK